MRHIPSSISTDESKGEAFTAKQILDKMEKAYLTCKSYCDSGMVKTVFIKPGGRWGGEKPFKEGCNRLSWIISVALASLVGILIVSLRATSVETICTKCHVHGTATATTLFRHHFWTGRVKPVAAVVFVTPCDHVWVPYCLPQCSILLPDPGEEEDMRKQILAIGKSAKPSINDHNAFRRFHLEPMRQVLVALRQDIEAGRTNAAIRNIDTALVAWPELETRGTNHTVHMILQEIEKGAERRVGE